jgi:hypothetical protein
MKKCLAACVIGLAMCAAAASASAEEAKKWEFGFAPYYLWAANIEGDTTLEGRDRETKIEFGDIFDQLEGVFTGHFEGLYEGKAGFLVDVVYIDISGDRESPTPFLKLDSKTTTSEFAAYYRFGGDTHSADVVAGVRYTKVEEDVDIEGVALTLEGSKSFTDPIIGGRYNWKMAEKWMLRLYGDIGGFGVGTDLTWAATGRIDYRAWKHVSLSAGYRALALEFDEDEDGRSFGLDLLIHGPILGLIFHW